MKHTRRLQNLQRFGGDKHRRGQFTKIRPKVRVIFNRSSRYFKNLIEWSSTFLFHYSGIQIGICFGKYFTLLELCVESTDILNRQTIQQTADLRSMEPTTRQPEADLIRCLLNCIIHNVRFNPNLAYFFVQLEMILRLEPQKKLSKIDQLVLTFLCTTATELYGKIKLGHKCLPGLI